MGSVSARALGQVESVRGNGIVMQQETEGRFEWGRVMPGVYCTSVTLEVTSPEHSPPFADR